MAEAEKSCGIVRYLGMFLCALMALLLATSMAPFATQAHAADEDKPDSVYLQLGNQIQRTDVMKNVVNLDANMGKDIIIPFDVNDKYNNVSTSDKRRRLVLEDSSGKQTQLSETSSDRVGFTSNQIVVGQKLKLITLTKNDKGEFVKRYEQQLNVRFTDTKKAEQKPAGAGSMAGISEDGGSWSFSNGLSYTFRNTGFKFLDGTTMNLGALKLPLTYKHNADGTTIVGINCSPEDKAFFAAIKNGNVWQKYSTDEIAKKTGEMDKGWSGKKFGTWGGKSFDWNVCGYMEFNTNDPQAPRAVNLIISMGMKAEGHAQYLIFTGTITFTVGGKAMLQGKLTPGKGLEGKFGLGAYAGLELYIGVGLQYVASVGAYGSGRIDIDFQILPDMHLDSIVLSGQCGAKAKVFGFTVYTWKILEGKMTLFKYENDKPKAAAQAYADEPASNEDGTATSPLTVNADTPYPVDSRSYLDDNTVLMGVQGDVLRDQKSASSTTISEGVYGETELACATTSSGPVMAYVADVAQVPEGGSRDERNRSVVVYKRMNSDGTWSAPRIIDTTTDSKDYADYTPSITADGDTCYVSWLAANGKIEEGATLGQVGQKLDVKMATITKGDSIENDQITIEKVGNESADSGVMPASPKAVRVGNDLYVGWYTNQTTGKNGEIIGLSGTHNIRLFKRGNDGVWSKSNEVTSGQSGAITSFDVGSYGGTAACVWSLDEQFSDSLEEVSLNGVKTLASSSVYTLVPNANGAQLIAMGATNAQFAKREGKDVLTYAIRIDPNDGVSSPYLSVMSSAAVGATDETVLDGLKVYLPTPYYEIAGDLGKGREGNISFLKANNGTCDIQALVTTGAGSTDWTSIVEATDDTNIVTDYCATYANGLPLFLYATERASAANGDSLSAQADDGAVDLNQTTDESLKHLSVIDLVYDEYETDSGQKMPVTVYFENDGLLDVSGVDLWMLEDETATKVASSDTAVALDGEGNISFEYTIPPKESFTKARKFTLYVAPKGAAVDQAKIKRELQDESAMTASLGSASLSLEANHQIVDDQESIIATVTNDGIASHGAEIAFINANTGQKISEADVPELGENESYSVKLDAPNGYFDINDINNVIITLENDGTESPGYEINNTEFVTTWDYLENDAPADDTWPMYRLYNPNSGEHFYTGDTVERSKVIDAGWSDEQVGWYAPAKDETIPVYRLYNQYGGEHHYTMDKEERDMLIGAGWNDEGIGWYSDPAQTIPLLREYNPYQFACNHNYTTDKEEHDNLITLGWKDEGTAWYAVKPGK